MLSERAQNLLDHASDKRKLSVIQEIIAWNANRFDEDSKMHFIKSYITGWTLEEEIHAITNRTIA